MHIQFIPHIRSQVSATLHVERTGEQLDTGIPAVTPNTGGNVQLLSIDARV